MSVQFDYYYARESGQFSFYRIPKVLFTDPTFHDLSVEAKLLYGLMLDRIGLSVRSGWVDEYGRVYIYFTHADIQEQLQCGHNKAVRLLKELDQGLGLIRRKRQGLGRPDRIYVMNFVSAMEVQISDYGNSEPEDFPEEPEEESQDAQNGNSRGETSVFETSGPPDSGGPDCPKADGNNTEVNKTDFNDTESIYPINLTQRLQDAMDEIEEKEALLRGKWGYTALLDHYRQEKLDGLISLGVDVLLSRKTTIRIGGQEVPTKQVQQRLLSLDFTHIDYVLECFQNTNTPIRNIRAYLLTALYNAPTTIDAYYENQVAQHEGIT